MTAEVDHLHQKLDVAKERLAREFGPTAGERVSECFDRVVAELVAKARVADFVAVLAERYARACIDAGP